MLKVKGQDPRFDPRLKTQHQIPKAFTCGRERTPSIYCRLQGGSSLKAMTQVPCRPGVMVRRLPVRAVFSALRCYFVQPGKPSTPAPVPTCYCACRYFGTYIFYLYSLRITTYSEIAPPAIDQHGGARARQFYSNINLQLFADNLRRGVISPKPHHLSIPSTSSSTLSGNALPKTMKELIGNSTNTNRS